MVLVQWRDEFCTGIADVDFEHQEMVALINDAHAELQSGSPRRDIEAFLGEIYTSIASHFALEERMMKVFKYDQYEEHKEDHERLLDEIRDIMDEYDAGDFDGLTEDLGKRLQSWFVDHFKTKDSRLHRMLG